MNIQVKIKPIGFKVLEEKDKIIDDVATIECIMEAEFSININEVQKATFSER